MVASTTKTPPPAASRAEAARLRASIQGFVRSFGLLGGDQTPCGKPLSLSHAHALMALLSAARQGETLTQQQLGRTLGIDKSNVARLCARMEAAGHLRQQRSADDGRRRLQVLTARGKKLAQQVEQASHDRFDRLLAALPETLRPSVFEALEALIEAASTLEKKP